MVAECKTREQLTCPTQHWPLMLLAEGFDRAVKHFRRDPQTQILRDRRTNPRQRILGPLRLKRRFLAAFEALEFLQQPAVLAASLEDLILKRFLAFLTGRDFRP